MVHHLSVGELGDGGQDPEGIARQKDHVAGMDVHLGWDKCIWDEMKRVCTASVLREGHIIIVYFAFPFVEYHVLQHAAKANRIENLRLFFPGQIDALGIAATLNIEDTLGCPNMLVVADEFSVWISAQCGLAGTTEAKE